MSIDPGMEGVVVDIFDAGAVYVIEVAFEEPDLIGGYMYDTAVFTYDELELIRAGS